METISPIKILIVEDQREVRRMLKAALESEFPVAYVVDVPSAEEAMVLLSREPFHLLVVDVRLAGMSGLEMAEKAVRRQPDLPIVAITGLSDPPTEQRLTQAPIRAWFRKPVPMEDFLARVKELIQHTPSSPSTTQEILPPDDQTKKRENTSETLDELSTFLGLQGLWVEDLQGRSLAQSSSLPGSQLNRAGEYFAQAGQQLEQLQVRYGSETFPAPLFYLDQEHLITRLTSDAFRITFWLSRVNLPPDALGMQQQALQKAQEVLNSVNQHFSLISPSLPSPVEQTADLTLEMLLNNPAALDPNQLKRADEFWEQSLEAEPWLNFEDPQTLPHDRARQLGLLSSETEGDLTER